MAAAGSKRAFIGVPVHPAAVVAASSPAFGIGNRCARMLRKLMRG
jgi:hypothetical protein